MCKSVKGAAFFGSSIHVVAAFIFLMWFLFDTVITEVGINLWKCAAVEDDPPRKRDVLVHYLDLVFKFFYYVFMCITGIYIFRGVERSSPRIIKFALLAFIIVQVIAMAMFITVQLTQWEDPIELEPVASRFVGKEVLLDDINDIDVGVNSSEIIQSDEGAFIPVLESPLMTTTTSTPPDPTPEIEVKVPKSPNVVWRKPSHNQQVEIVFMIFLAGFNFVGSSIYIGILLAYLLTL